jgi:hypothetical protein
MWKKRPCGRFFRYVLTDEWQEVAVGPGNFRGRIAAGTSGTWYNVVADGRRSLWSIRTHSGRKFRGKHRWC